MNSTGYIYGSRADASDARREARPDQDWGGQQVTLVPGYVSAVQADGVYQVTTLADDGTDGAVIEQVRTFPLATLAVDDNVWLVFRPGSPMPTILQSGGGATGCDVAPTMLGAYVVV